MTCVCVCVFIPFILDVRLVDVPAGVTQEEGHTGFLHLPSAVFALTFLAGRIQPFLSFVDREVDFLCTNELIFLYFLGIFFFLCEEKSQKPLFEILEGATFENNRISSSSSFAEDRAGELHRARV